MHKIKLTTILVAGIMLASSLVAKPIKVLMLGGDRHHEYKKLYGGLDKKLLEKGGLAKVTYTEDIVVAGKSMSETDIFMACGNIKYDDALKTAILDLLDRGKSMMLMHAATWTRKGWPLLNTDIVGGKPKGHEKKGLIFDVKVLMPDHLLMKDMPPQFEIVDELYRMDYLEKEIKWTILCQSSSRETDFAFASIVISERKKGKVLWCTLGHDELAHNVPAYQQFLRNAVTWLSDK